MTTVNVTESRISLKVSLQAHSWGIIWLKLASGNFYEGLSWLLLISMWASSSAWAGPFPGQETHLHCGQDHSLGRRNQAKQQHVCIHHSLLPGCKCHVTSCFRLPLPWNPQHDGLYLEVGAKINPLSFKLLSSEVRVFYHGNRGKKSKIIPELTKNMVCLSNLDDPKPLLTP